MTFRKFWLINNEGERFDLQDSERVFASNPRNLGTEAAVNVFKIGDSTIVNYKQFQMTPIQFKLLFTSNVANTYRDYRDFFRFMAKEPIRLFYQTTDKISEDDSFFTTVSLINIAKEEFNHESGVLESEISLLPLVYWQTNKENLIELESQVENGKQYLLKRPYHYAADSISNVKIINESPMPVPVIIEFDGIVENPTYTIFDSDKNMYGVGRFKGTYDYVFVNSQDINQKIVLKKDGAILPNAARYQDVTLGKPNQVFLTFIRLNPGESYMKFGFDNNFVGKIRVYWRDQYATV